MKLSENQEYRLKRTLVVSGLVVLAITGTMFLMAVDIVLWQQQIFSWVTYTNFLPFIGSLTLLSMPFWVAGASAEYKLRKER